MKVLPLPCLLLCLVSSTAALAVEPPAKVLELTIPGGALPKKPQVLRVEKDDLVRLRVTSDVAGEVHLHGYRLEMKLTPGTPQDLTFKTRATGRYRIEWHPAGATKSKDDTHGPALAILEVRPK